MLQLLTAIYLLWNKTQTFAQPCPNEQLTKVGQTTVFRTRVPAAILFRADMAVDADGSPRAYHPTNDQLALDFKANGFPCCVAKKQGQAVIQGPNDPAPGFYVSMTALIDPTKRETDPAHYVNSETIPYYVLPPEIIRLTGARTGDMGAVLNRKTGHVAFAIFADVGPRGKLGEGSIALVKALELNKTPKKGGSVADLTYIVFPGSGNRRPRRINEINRVGADLLKAWGGIDKLSACLTN